MPTSQDLVIFNRQKTYMYKLIILPLGHVHGVISPPPFTISTKMHILLAKFKTGNKCIRQFCAIRHYGCVIKISLYKNSRVFNLLHMELCRMKFIQFFGAPSRK